MPDTGTQQVADDLGRCQATIQSWINRFRANGIDGLLSKGKGNGPQSRLTAEMEKAMTANWPKANGAPPVMPGTGSAPCSTSAS